MPEEMGTKEQREIIDYLTNYKFKKGTQDDDLGWFHIITDYDSSLRVFELFIPSVAIRYSDNIMLTLSDAKLTISFHLYCLTSKCYIELYDKKINDIEAINFQNIIFNGDVYNLNHLKYILLGLFGSVQSKALFDISIEDL